MMARATGQPAVLLCDRGAMDGSAYMPPETWQKLLEKTGYTNSALREGRYNAVFHLVTAADGAESFYTNAGGHRLEPPDLARMLDGKTLGAWRGHHNLTVFDNESFSTFAGKVNAVVEAAAKLVRLPSSTQRTRKFLLSLPEGRLDPSNWGVPTEQFEVEKVFPLPTPYDKKVGYSYVRQRSQGGGHAYGQTVVEYITSDGVAGDGEDLTPNSRVRA